MLIKFYIGSLVRFMLFCLLILTVLQLCENDRCFGVLAIYRLCFPLAVRITAKITTKSSLDFPFDSCSSLYWS